ncbi:DUF4394 domain-containing protein [Nevskia sp.]|uniref:DUF4394 domain-containing protein n=1 Tax=Nevskia sp. TaxID=1929292 RepID=UPI0025F96CBE|nr:DUF4394 domain-containing protein [Nevskia sp.]
MAKRHVSWTAAAAAIFLAGCDNQLTFPPPAPPPVPAPITTDSYLVTSTNRLVGFNRATPGTTPVSFAIGGLAAGESVIDVAFRPNDGLLYGLVAAGANARIVTINPTTGATTAVSTLSADATDTTAPYTGLVGTRFGIDFNPVPDRLRVISDGGQNLRINVANGATITDTALNGASTAATATTYSNAFNAACRTMQFAIDPATDRLFLQNPPNDGVLTAIGGLGVDAVSVGGLDISTSATGTNSAFAVLNTAAGTAFYTINTTTGAAAQVAAITLNAGETAAGFATRALSTTPAQAAGELLGVTADADLVTFNRGSPAKLCTTGTVTGLPAGVSLLSIDTRPASGGIVALASDNSLYSISGTGLAAPLCPLVTDPTDLTAPYSALPAGASFGAGFNPVPDRLRVTASNGLNLRINAIPNANGQCLVITDTPLTGATAVTAVSYTNTIAGAGSTTLYGVDSGSDNLVRIGNDPANGIANDPGNPNSGVAVIVGSLGVGDVASTDAFLIDGRNNMAFLASGATGATASTFYNVNLATGAATAAGSVGGGLGTPAADPLIGMALTTGATLNVRALTTDNRLLSFSQTNNVFTPNTGTDVAITGLSAGENMLGIDFRPANNTLYGISSLNRVYVINTTTGLATLSAALAADPTDASAPFTAVSAGATFGTDFNPVPDRLRVVDTAGGNLRINVATGATITDGAINGVATSGLLAAGYTNSFAGATTTTLYDMDATRLFTQVPPNDGTLVLVGATGVTAVGDAGLDIAGGANGLVLAAIRTQAGAGPSSLYRINLATGAATAIGAPGGTGRIGSATSAQVRSIAIDAR